MQKRKLQCCLGPIYEIWLFFSLPPPISDRKLILLLIMFLFLKLTAIHFCLFLLEFWVIFLSFWVTFLNFKLFSWVLNYFLEFWVIFLSFEYFHPWGFFSKKSLHIIYKTISNWQNFLPSLQPSFPVPRSIELQYDQVYNNNGTVTLDTIRQSVAENYQRRPNELDPFGPGPSAAGLQALFSTFGGTFSNFKVFRQKFAVISSLHSCLECTVF